MGADIEVGVGDPVPNRAGAEALTDYRLGLYASREYLWVPGTHRSNSELVEHPLIYYIEGLLRVDDLDLLDRFGTDSHAAFGSTSVHVQLKEATVHGATALASGCYRRSSPSETARWSACCSTRWRSFPPTTPAWPRRGCADRGALRRGGHPHRGALPPGRAAATPRSRLVGPEGSRHHRIERPIQVR